MSVQKKVAILQSNYIPWKGYFDIIAMVDEFIFLDEVQFTKNDWRNRNKIKGPSGPVWLTIPVRHESLSQKIQDTQIASRNWSKKHWNAISLYYSRAKAFNEYKDIFREMIKRESPEAKLFWQLDKLDLAVQALQYEREYGKTRHRRWTEIKGRDLRQWFQERDLAPHGRQSAH